MRKKPTTSTSHKEWTYEDVRIIAQQYINECTPISKEEAKDMVQQLQNPVQLDATYDFFTNNTGELFVYKVANASANISNAINSIYEANKIKSYVSALNEFGFTKISAKTLINTMQKGDDLVDTLK